MPSSSIAATGAVVVSKPATKNTTCRCGFSLAILTASCGLDTGRISAPAALACSSERGSDFGTFTGTRSMSPNATRITPACKANWIAR